MEISASERESVLNYLKNTAQNGACLLPSFREAAEACSMRPGRLKAVLYLLSGEGVILQEERKILLLEEN